jgi:hypothetical protein
LVSRLCTTQNKLILIIVVPNGTLINDSKLDVFGGNLFLKYFKSSDFD